MGSGELHISLARRQLLIDRQKQLALLALFLNRAGAEAHHPALPVGLQLYLDRVVLSRVADRSRGFA